MTQSVVQASKLACEWDIPEPDGGKVDPNLVNVEFSTGGNTQKIGYAGSLANCANVQGGWYFDDALTPKKVFVCPDTCNVVQGVSDAEIRVLLGCKRETAVPKWTAPLVLPSGFTRLRLGGATTRVRLRTVRRHLR